MESVRIEPHAVHYKPYIFDTSKLYKHNTPAPDFHPWVHRAR